MPALRLPELPARDADTLKRAVRNTIEMQAMDAASPSIGPRTLAARLPSATRLEAAAALLAEKSGEDAEAARHFLGLVEAAYLIACADGLADEERDALIDLIAHTTGGTVPGAMVDELFAGFQSALAKQGLEMRLREVAKSFDDFMAREEAMSFASLIAIADGVLSTKEEVALIALGARLDFSVGEVQAVVNQVAASLKRAMG
jgi:tellurite resistance protein